MKSGTTALTQEGHVCRYNETCFFDVCTYTATLGIESQGMTPQSFMDYHPHIFPNHMHVSLGLLLGVAGC